LELGAVGAIVAGSAGATHFYNLVRAAMHKRNQERLAKHRAARRAK